MWGTNLIEMNCHLHPLDTMATKTKVALSEYQNDGKECNDAIVIYKISKLRYKDNRGDPKGFKMFLPMNGLPFS